MYAKRKLLDKQQRQEKKKKKEITGSIQTTTPHIHAVKYKTTYKRLLWSSVTWTCTMSVDDSVENDRCG